MFSLLAYIISNLFLLHGLEMATCMDFSDSDWDLNPPRDVHPLFSHISDNDRSDIAVSPPRRGRERGYGYLHLGGKRTWTAFAS